MMIEHSLQIDAPAELVWAVICDLDSYPEWNPFVVSCSSTLGVGDPIQMWVRIFPFFAQPQRERIFEHEPGRRLCYGLSPNWFGALASRRSHNVESIAPARTHYLSHFELSGWLEPLVAALLGTRLAAGFDAMSSALKVRVEALASRRGA